MNGLRQFVTTLQTVVDELIWKRFLGNVPAVVTTLSRNRNEGTQKHVRY